MVSVSSSRDEVPGAADGFALALFLAFAFGGGAFDVAPAPAEEGVLADALSLAAFAEAWSLPCSSLIIPRTRLPSTGPPIASRRSSTRCTTEGVGPRETFAAKTLSALPFLMACLILLERIKHVAQSAETTPSRPGMGMLSGFGLQRTGLVFVTMPVPLPMYFSGHIKVFP